MFLVKDVLTENGLFAKKMAHFEYRPGQLKMSNFVNDIIVEKKIGIVEAGTGIGKGMAYLTAALTTHKFPVIISTYTINLQNQLLKKDIPIIENVLGKEFKSILLKGRNNYVCLRKLTKVKSFGIEATLFNHSEIKKNLKLIDKIYALEQGDRELFPFFIPQLLWEEINCSAETCFRSKCPFFKSCYFYKVRRKLQNSDIIITNHSLFFKELMPLIEKEPQKYNTIIFDEAHHLEDVAQEHFTLSLTKRDFEFINKYIEKNIIKSIEDSEKKVECSSILKKLNEDSKEYFNLFSKNNSFEKRIELSEKELETGRLLTIKNSLQRLEHILNNQEKLGNYSLLISENICSLRKKLDKFIDFDDNEFVYFIEKYNTHVELRVCNIDFQNEIKSSLFGEERGIVFTSATLCSAGDMKYFKDGLGIPSYAESLIVESPFDFSKQAICYIPKDLPDFKEIDFLEKAAYKVEKILEVSRGRAFILFTSYSMLNNFWDYFNESLEIKGYTPLRQENGASSDILKKFYNQEKSVLFGTDRFWEGVDIPGDKLSCVIIMKLPFSVPGDPIYKRYEEKVRSLGENPFMKLSLPNAILKLRQGMGRLIRRASDRGILAVMDSRIHTKRYGRIIIDSLPRMKITDEISKIRDFFE